MKKWFAIAVLAFTGSIICFLFWQSEWKYSLPTPVPFSYQAINMGAYIDIKGKFEPAENGAIFLHFFNPDCPCSRFNLPHFMSLVKAYGDEINFAVVVITKDKSYTAASVQEKFGLTVPVLFDSSIARACGVYSTPQAVLLDKDHHLYFRGNYNRNRYCTDKKTNYAQMAIDSLLHHKQEPLFNKYVVTAYGCSLPGCTK